MKELYAQPASQPGNKNKWRVCGRQREEGGEVSPSCGGGAGKTFVPCLQRSVSLSLSASLWLDLFGYSIGPLCFEHTGPICQPGSILDWMSISRFKVGRFALVALCVCVVWAPLNMSAYARLKF